MFSNKKKIQDMEDVMSSNNIIGKGTLIEGNISATANIRIDGKVVGNIMAKGKVVIGETGVLEGNIESTQAEISGNIKGKIIAGELVVLHPSAVVEGDISTNQLAVDSGAVFNGSCKIISDAKKNSSNAKQILELQPK